MVKQDAGITIPDDSGAHGMMSPPYIDVVILSFDRVEETLQAIESIENQINVSPLTWIVDQGSSDACLQRLRQKCGTGENLTLVELEKNIGVAAGRNLGMSLGNSQYLVVIDNDAELASPLAMKYVFERFEADPTLGAIGFKILNAATGQYDKDSWVYPRQLFSHRDEPFKTTRFCGAGHALRRSALERTHLYDEALFFYWEEVDLSYQLIGEGYSIVYDPEIIVLHKVSKEARTSWDENRFYYLVRNALYLDYKYFRSPLRVLAKAVGYFLKGIYNGWLGQTIRGIRDSRPMILSILKSFECKLDKNAREYIVEHEMTFRGSLWERIQKEVFETMD